jgi:hypothetical protein
MPYFVYKIYPGKRFVPVQSFDSFKDARELARSMRVSTTPQDSYTAKVIFAKSHEQAERLLSEEREYIPREDD